MSIEEIIKRAEEMKKETENKKANNPINPYVLYINGNIDKKQLISLFLKNFYTENFKDDKIETKKLFLGTLTYIEGESIGTLIEPNTENNVTEKCILYPVIKTVHNGTVFLDIINKTLIETKYGFTSFGNIRKAGILVESARPLNEVMAEEIASMDELKAFSNKANNQKQKTKKF